MGSLIRIVGIIAVAALIGSLNAGIRGLPWTPNVQRAAETARLRDELNQRHAELRARLGITLDQFRAAIAAGSVIIDARPRSEFEKAHLAVDRDPPVLNVESNDVPAHLDRLRELSGQPLVIYCTSETCELAEELFVALEPYGFFSDVKIFFPGWKGIEEAKLPVVGGPDTWTALGSAAASPTESGNDGTADSQGNPGEEHP